MDEDNDPLTYKVEYCDKKIKKWKLLDEWWLKFSYSDLAFTGTPPKEDLDKIY